MQKTLLGAVFSVLFLVTSQVSASVNDFMVQLPDEPDLRVKSWTTNGKDCAVWAFYERSGPNIEESDFYIRDGEVATFATSNGRVQLICANGQLAQR